VFTRVLHWPLSWVSWIQSIPPPLRSILIHVFPHLCPGLPSGLFPSSFPISYMHSSPMCATCHAHLNLLDLSILYLANRTSYDTVYGYNRFLNVQYINILGCSLVVWTFHRNLLPSFKMLVYIFYYTWCPIPRDHNFNTQCSENIKSQYWSFKSAEFVSGPQPV
jgi:hypothetical protein